MQKGFFVTISCSFLIACGSSSSNNDVNEPIVKTNNAKPIATNASIRFNNSKTLYTGTTLEATYHYSDNEQDAEGRSELRWLVDNEVKGTSQTYTIKKSDAGKSIIFEVTPVAATGTQTGDAVQSDAVVASLRQFVPFTAGISEGERVTFVTDGTAENTYSIADFNVDASSENLSYSMSLEDKWLLSTSTKDYGYALAITDGTTEGTELLSAAYSNLSPSGFTKFKDKTFFKGYQSDSGSELWVTDGTIAGTELFKDLAPGYIAEQQAFSGNPRHLTVINDKLIFTAYSRSFGTELWVSDGTAGGTRQLKDMTEGYYGSEFDAFFSFKNHGYFNIKGQFYITDGTADGTNKFLVKGLWNPTLHIELDDNQMIILANNLSGYANTGLWISDGSEEGTYLIDAQNSNNTIQALKVIDGVLYYVYKQILMSYSPQAGTKEVTRDFTLVDSLTELNGTLYFRGRTENGYGLYQYSNDLVSLVKLTSDANDSYIESLSVLNDTIIFIGTDQTHGTEVWISDGTENGTQILTDIFPSTASSQPSFCHLSEINCIRR